MALFNNFPYSNTEEINLDYTLNKLNELYSRGENLYAELQSWKTATDEANEAWKSDLLSDINEWQNSVTQSIEQWKNSVDSEVANALTSLSNQITAELTQAKADLRNEVADLASAAAASASDAAASQSVAAQSAQTAVNSAAAAAQSEQNISESAAQIETNTNDINDLQDTIDDINNLTKKPFEITWVQGGINTAGGNANATNRIRTNYITVTGINTVNITVNSGYAWRIFYYQSGTFTSAYGPSSASMARAIPEGTTSIRFYLRKTDDTDLTPEKGVNFGLTYDIPVVEAINKNTRYIDNLYWCDGKKLNWLGDSIVAGADFDEEVTNALNITEHDYGINGSTIALAADGTDGRNACCVRYPTMDDDTDIIAVSCGTNDFQYAWCPIGDIDSTDNTTFYGALKNLCEGLINKYPQKVIFFTTPIKRAQAFENGNGGEYTPDGVMTTPFSKNKYGKTLGDYAEIIKEVCKLYSIPVLDMYGESLLNPHITSQQDMFDNVLTHPNSTGQKIMARRICGWLIQLGFKIY